MKKQKQFVARLTGCLNYRYYVIELRRRVYIIDYANPKDIRSYFPGFFPKYNREYTVYDITATQEQYAIRSVPWLQSYFRQFTEWWFVVGLMMVAAIISHLRIEWLYNQDVPRFWKMILLIYVIGAVGIIFWLNRITKEPKGLLEEKSYKLERKPRPRYVNAKQKVKTGPVGDFILTLFGQSISLVFLFNYSYIMVLLGFFAGYSILFIRFLNLYEVLNMNKFIFVEEEE